MYNFVAFDITAIQLFHFYYNFSTDKIMPLLTINFEVQIIFLLEKTVLQ